METFFVWWSTLYYFLSMGYKMIHICQDAWFCIYKSFSIFNVCFLHGFRLSSQGILYEQTMEGWQQFRICISSQCIFLFSCNLFKFLENIITHQSFHLMRSTVNTYILFSVFMLPCQDMLAHHIQNQRSKRDYFNVFLAEKPYG